MCCDTCTHIHTPKIIMLIRNLKNERLWIFTCRASRWVDLVEARDLTTSRRWGMDRT